MRIEVHRKDGEIENRPVSKGGKLFDFLTYFGIAAVGTFLMTIPTAALFMEGGRFRNAYLWVDRNLQQLGLSPRLAKHGADTFATIHGGNIMLIPVGIMEHYRTRIVQAFNRMLNDPTDPKSIEEAPPQTASSIIKARLIATATVFTGFVGAETLIGEARYKRGLERAGEKVYSMFKSGAVNRTHWLYNFGKTGALDILATASSASLLYIGSHFFARKSYEKKAEKAYIERKKSSQQEVDAPAVSSDPAPARDIPPEQPTTKVTATQHDAAIRAAAAQPEQPMASL